MSEGRFQFQSTDSENKFEEIGINEDSREDYTPMLESSTEIGEAELSTGKNLLSLSVPISFSLFGKRFSITDSTNYSSGSWQKKYHVRAQDGSSFTIEVNITSLRR